MKINRILCTVNLFSLAHSSKRKRLKLSDKEDSEENQSKNYPKSKYKGIYTFQRFELFSN